MVCLEGHYRHSSEPEEEYEGVDMAECGMQAYPEFVGFVPSTGPGEGTPSCVQPNAAEGEAADGRAPSMSMQTS